MINRVVLVGRLTKDPVLRKTASGASVVSFTVACDRRIKTEGQPSADFINTVAWNKTADIVSQYMHKGSLVGVEGRIQTRSYDDQSGKRVYITEVVADSVQFLEPKGTSNGASMGQAYVPSNEPVNNGYQSDTSTSQSSSNDFQSSDSLDIASDDLPF
ncbi:MAG: single-stranded DNA-binding protein [Longicatena sp.]